MDADKLSESTLILIDCQNTYRDGVMKLDGIEPALDEAATLLGRARVAGIPIVHIRHDSGPGSPFDLTAENGQIADKVAPEGDEAVITKKFPNSFEQTELDAHLKSIGANKLLMTGFMSHMCVNSTARAAFEKGYDVTVVAGATATRPLPDPTGGEIDAGALHRAALTALSDVFAVVVPSAADVPD